MKKKLNPALWALQYKAQRRYLLYREENVFKYVILRTNLCVYISRVVIWDDIERSI
jgi:hypothetical protein